MERLGACYRFIHFCFGGPEIAKGKKSLQKTKNKKKRFHGSLMSRILYIYLDKLYFFLNREREREREGKVKYDILNGAMRLLYVWSADSSPLPAAQFIFLPKNQNGLQSSSSSSLSL